MVEFMLSLPEIFDPEMPDGTTGFSMALARDNPKLVELLLSYYQKYTVGRIEEKKRDIRIAEDAIMELDHLSPMKSVLEKGLEDFEHARKAPRPQKPKCKR